MAEQYIHLRAITKKLPQLSRKQLCFCLYLPAWWTVPLKLLLEISG
jgi:hypothetical protein